MKIFLLFLLSVIFFPVAYGEKIVEEGGIISDLIVSDNSEIFFFELDDTIKSPTWIHDTYIMTSDGYDTHKVSDVLFIFPTELNEFEDNLYFAVLSDQCLEDIICDYQEIIKMSKDGSFETISTNLKSAIHIFIENKNLFVSESNGNIWRIALDGHEKELLYHGENIIMDIAASKNMVYWIEEIEDMDSRILGISNEKELEIIDEDLSIPYDLRVEDNILHWNDISIKGKQGKLGEFTTIKTFEDNSVRTILEFENTSPIALKNISSYGPYRTFGDYVFVVNNTQNDSIIHLLGMEDNTKYDVTTIIDYDVKFLRNDVSNLYVIGINDDGFVIEHFSLPVSVPEFSSSVLLVMPIIGLSLIVFLRKSFPN